MSKRVLKRVSCQANSQAPIKSILPTPGHVAICSGVDRPLAIY
jgi:hypothetical protein